MLYLTGNDLNSEATQVLWKSSFSFSLRVHFNFSKFHENKVKHDKCNMTED